jgi:ELWxxDGT repeat protein
MPNPTLAAVRSLTLPVALCLAAAPAARTQTPILDLNAQPAATVEPVVSHFLPHFGRTWFFVRHPDRPRSTLWSTDGTPGGTVPHFDEVLGIPIRPLWAWPDRGPTFAQYLLVQGDDPATRSTALIATDGTAAGSIVVTRVKGDIRDVIAKPTGITIFSTRGVWQVAPGASVAAQLADVETVNALDAGSQMFFRTRDAWWRTDGTDGGTRFLATTPNLMPGHVHNGNLWFFHESPQYGLEPWISDGTVAGTRLVADLVPGTSGSSNYPYRPKVFESFRGNVVFPALDASNTYRLWTSDGTSAGTRTLTPRSFGPPNSYQPALAVWQGRLCYASGDRTTAPYFTLAIWATDGTPGGEVRLWANSSPPVDAIDELLPVGNTLFAHANDFPTFGRGAIAIDATTLQETTLPGVARAIGATSDGLRMFFTQSDLVTRVSPGPMVSDGTANGTQLLVNLTETRTAPGMRSAPETFAGHVWFFGSDGQTGNQLWRTDGTAAGTVPLSASWPGPIPEVALGLRPWRVANRLCFVADDGRGRAVWSVDGAGTTTRLMPVVLSVPTEAHVFGIDRAPVTGSYGVVATNGTTAGTTRVYTNPSIAGGIVAVEESAAFVSADKLEVWRTNGSVAGTRSVYRHTSALTLRGASGRHVLASDDMRAILAVDTLTGVANVLAPANSPPLRTVHSLGKTAVLQFASTPLDTLRVTDGTLAGTVDVGPILAANAVSAAPGRVVYLRRVVERIDVWTTDGTPTGTRAIATLPLGITQPAIGGLAEVAPGRFTFHVNAGTSAPRVYVTDGTANGTRLAAIAHSVRRIDTSMARTGDRFVFAATTLDEGTEPFAFGLAELAFAQAERIGAGCSNGATLVPDFAAVGAPTLGAARFALRITRAVPSAPAALLFGDRVAPVDLGNGCTLYVPPAGSVVLSLSTDASGVATLALPIPASAALRGASFVGQGAIWQAQPTTLGWTNALRCTIGD